MKTKHSRQNQNYVRVLQKTARVTLPFYKKIAKDKLFARRWSDAVRKADLDRMDRLMRQSVPRFDHNQYGLSVNGIGYFIDVIVPRPLGIYTSSAAIPPGKVQFYFCNRSHRLIAQAILPLYEAIQASETFSNTIVEAVKRNEKRVLEQVIRSKVKSPYLRRIRQTAYGFTLRFSFPFDNYPYDHALFHEVP